MIYEAWGSIDTGAHTFSTSEGIRDMLSKGMMEEGDEHLFSIRADSWEEAMTIYHEAQGWEPYRPL